MGISQYLKKIGRGARGARPLTREEAEDLFGKVLDGDVTDLEVGAFCLAMRIKGETVEEMAGFIEAARARMSLVAPSVDGRPSVILPSYNGARRLPVLTPLLALLLVNRGLRVIVHGITDDPGRITTAQVLRELGHCSQIHVTGVKDDAVNLLPIQVLSPKLSRLLNVRHIVGLRNSAHSLVKLINPCTTRALVIGSYTHTEYAVAMARTYSQINADALLLRGIEGEAVADARKVQQIDAFIAGRQSIIQRAENKLVDGIPDWPTNIEPSSIARYVTDVLNGCKPVPTPIALQVQHIEKISRAIQVGNAIVDHLVETTSERVDDFGCANYV